ncbi:MAG: hypothetical protein BZY88_19775 [SAR202 cluster bacterium Io17-Chloro-G9]|nr:MAG: hypothetical protein BZY88_19775 [SAR202 cluster bacterium Io17-Chloro-G9]
MGLVQNQVEAAGVATVSMTVQPHITASVGAPRAVYIRYPAGNQLGEAGKPIQQRAILTSALEAAIQIQTPGTIVELPYRWRRFPIQEDAQYAGESQGPRHVQVEAMGQALDSLARLVREYKEYLEGRAAQDAASAAPVPGLDRTFQTQIARLEQMAETLDTQVLDQLRELTNAIATMELRAIGKFV